MLGLAFLMRSKQSWGSVNLHQRLSEEPQDQLWILPSGVSHSQDGADAREVPKG